jgi:uncharacterized protein YxjI
MSECAQCGVIFAKQKRVEERRVPSDDFEPNFQRLLIEPQRLYIEQNYRHWYEILLNWEQRNEYSVRDEGNRSVGWIVEQGTGIVAALLRVFTGSHRPFNIAVLSANYEPILELDRQFFFLFSNMEIKGATGQRLGRVRRRFAILYREYDLEDRHGRVFAKIRSPLFRFWTFPVVDASGQQRAVITKKWSGLGKEYFTDADNFGVDFGDGRWMPDQRAVIFAASIAIDFDFFENNQNR